MDNLEKDYKPYTGDALQKAREKLQYRPFKVDRELDKSEEVYIESIPAYFPDENLKKAVELARILKRPLLLRGEPGCGKTRLAQAVAFELYGKDYRQKYFEWYIKSTTKAKEGLYSFDHLARLRDIEAKEEKSKAYYREFGPLGNTFITSSADAPSVLLIDEIDKADLDFPNDLLLELDQMRFFVNETGEEVVAAYAPIIFITSNDEKTLPDAFLRRCVFHYITFPGEQALMQIAQAKIQSQMNTFKKEFSDSLLEDCIKKFLQLYGRMKQDPNTDKLPSTSELLDWLRALHYYHFRGDLQVKRNEETKKDQLLLQGGKLPYLQALVKSLDDFNSQMKEDNV